MGLSSTLIGLATSWIAISCMAISCAIICTIGESAQPAFAQPAPTAGSASTAGSGSTGSASSIQSSKDPKLDRFELAIKIFELKDKRNPPPPDATVFVGSSTFAKWGSTLERQFQEFKAINRGFGGSTIPESTYYADRIVTNYKPARVVLYAGTNDIANGHSAQRVFDDFKLFCQKIHSALPNTQIYFISISVAPSRIQLEQTNDAANNLIQKYIAANPYLHFIDVRPVMRDKNGKLRDDLFIFDRLHMNEAGYALWTPVIRQALQTSR